MLVNQTPLAALLQNAATRAIAYRETLPDRPQRPELDYPAMLARMRAPTPEHATPAPDVIAELDALATPGLHAMAGPRFFGWVIGGSHPAGVAADWLAAAWGQNAASHAATPAAAAAETIAGAWLLDLLGLPRDAAIGFVTGATVANFTCLAAARGAVLRRAGWDVEADGMFGAPPIRVFIGDDAHTTVFAALRFLGLGHARVERIPTDAAGRMRADAFATAAATVTGPAIAIAQAGQINTGAFDPFPEIAAAARAHNIWLHVDGAFGLWARACPAVDHLATGVDLADSWAVDGHKWLQIPYDCGYAIVRDGEAMRRAMTAAASYLPATGEGERDPSHHVPELSRRARGFATWAVIRALGRKGIAAMIARHHAIAASMAMRLAAEPGITVLNDVVLNQAIIRFGADRPDAEADRLTQAVIARVQQDGDCFAGGALWRGRWVMRLSVINWETTMADATRAATAIIRAWRAVRSTPS